MIEKLKALGLSVEILEPRLIALDVPPTADVDTVTRFLSNQGIPWEYANPILN